MDKSIKFLSERQAETQLATMVAQAMQAIAEASATVERDIGDKRIRVTLQKGVKEWYVNGVAMDVRDVVRILMGKVTL